MYEWEEYLTNKTFIGYCFGDKGFFESDLRLQKIVENFKDSNEVCKEDYIYFFENIQNPRFKIFLDKIYIAIEKKQELIEIIEREDLFFLFSDDYMYDLSFKVLDEPLSIAYGVKISLNICKVNIAY